MKFYGYFVNGICYGCTNSAKKRAEQVARETGAKVVRALYKV